MHSDALKQLEPYVPDASNPWDRRKVAHLYRRAAFGANWSELEQGLKLGPQACVDQLLAGGRSSPITEADFAAIARTAIAAGSDRNLQGWWLFRMMAGSDPLAERMTLFWHDHFATSQDKVGDLGLMHQQNELFRKFALGHFWDKESGGLLMAVSRDPAMLVWLDSNANRRAAPNENYAREIMELFALGIGNYSEQDIREAARAFTGWFVNKKEFLFVSSEHDTGSKVVFNRRGDWDGADVVRIIAEQPAASRFLVAKLCQYLVSESGPLEPDLLAQLSDGFRDREYDVRWLVATILRSKLFFSAAAFRRKIASPVDFVVGTARRLEGSRMSPAALAEVSAKLGQTLFHPPNVAGWEEGMAWINSSSLLGRSNFAQEIVASSGGRFAGRVDPVDLANRNGCRADSEVVQFYLDLLVDGEVPAETRAQLVSSLGKPVGRGDSRSERVRRLVQLILTSPEYNLC